MKLAIVEDEKIHQDYLTSMLEIAANQLGISLSLNIFSSAESFLFSMEDEKFSAVLLDIMLDKMNGFSLAEKIRTEDMKIPIAFITGERDYVFDGYKVDACGYILKPIKQDNITELLKKLKVKTAESEKVISFKTKDGMQNFYESEIAFIESSNHNTNLNTQKGSFISSTKMGEWEKTLSVEKFFKPHRCYLINMEHIDRIEKKNIFMKSGEDIPIARGKWEVLMKKYMDYRRKEHR